MATVMCMPAVSSRFDRIDNFWFVLRHELEHVDRRHGLSTVMLDAELEGDRAGVGDGVAEEERVANEAAAEFCVPKRMIDAFIARKAPFFYEHDIRGFAATLKVHPGLIAGQLRYRTGLYNRFGNHIVKVRSILAPNAIVDGRHQVFPHPHGPVTFKDRCRKCIGMTFCVVVPDSNCHLGMKRANLNGLGLRQRISRGPLSVSHIVVKGHGATPALRQA
jgi:hypothetical protein